jgi:ech hydrogenase subunit B
MNISSMTAKIIAGIITVILAPVVGGLLNGIDRKISARMQSRQGPPITQPFYDVIKLFGKERIAVNRFQDIYVIVYALFIATGAVMLFTGQDLLMLVFVLAIGDVALVMGAMSVRSPYSRIGAEREIIQIMAAEPVIILTVIGIYLVNNSFLGSYIYTKDKPLLFSLPLLFIALLIVLTIKLRKSPFDFSSSEHAHTELLRGFTTEFSGFQLAMIEIGEWIETVVMLGLVAIFWAQPIWAGILIAVAAYLIEILVDNVSARTTWGWMLKFVGIVGLCLSIANIIWLYLR